MKKVVGVWMVHQCIMMSRSSENELLNVLIFVLVNVLLL